MKEHNRYSVKVVCPTHETGTAGFLNALDAYEYIEQMEEIYRHDVISVEIKLYKDESGVTDE